MFLHFRSRVNEASFNRDTLWFVKVISLDDGYLRVEGMSTRFEWNETINIPDGFQVFHPPSYPHEGTIVLRHSTLQGAVVEPSTFEMMERCGNVAKALQNKLHEMPCPCGEVHNNKLIPLEE